MLKPNFKITKILLSKHDCRFFITHWLHHDYMLTHIINVRKKTKTHSNLHNYSLYFHINNFLNKFYMILYEL